MPALPPVQIINALEVAFSESGPSAILVSSKRQNPRRYYVASGEAFFSLWVYFWTLTHGGGSKRLEDEYRIQLTSVEPPLPLNPNGPTLLLGYEPNISCFAGFDLRKHQHFSKKSPSIQININALREAVKNGFAFLRKGNDEIAIGIRPDNLLAYALNSETLHEEGANAYLADLFTRVGRFEKISQEELDSLSESRKRVVSKVSRLVRDGDFRRKVTVAYDRKCCVSGIQLKLIDAAHILPVGAEGSTDDVTNGLCLSPTYHRAYDRGLIVLSENRVMQINEQKRDELVNLGLGGGLREFESHLGREIHLPPDRNQWPNPDLIRKSNKFRGL